VTVYAIIAARAAPRSFRPRTGVRLDVLRSDTIAAIVAHRDAPAAPTAGRLRQYDLTLQELAQSVPAILPVRFGTRMPEEELRSVLASRRQALVRALAHVRRRAQMTVRVLRTATARGREVGLPPEGGSYATKGGSYATKGGSYATKGGSYGTDGGSYEILGLTGRDYLRRRAEEEAAARFVPGFEPVRNAVARWVRDERVEHRAGVSSVYHLVPRSSAAAYRRAAQLTARSAGLTALVSGPYPPYAFATLE
jgi:hypothetical protein